MTERAFVDTNVWVYLHDPASPEKRELAKKALRRLGSNVAISNQVLGEFFHTIVRSKGGRPALLARDRAARIVRRMARMRSNVPADADLLLDALDLAEERRVSIWDGLMLRSAKAAGCRRMLSEDLNAGEDYDGVVVENPFAPPGA